MQEVSVAIWGPAPAATTRFQNLRIKVFGNLGLELGSLSVWCYEVNGTRFEYCAIRKGGLDYMRRYAQSNPSHLVQWPAIE